MPSPLAGRPIALVTRLYGPEPGVASYRLGALARAMRDAGASSAGADDHLAGAVPR